MTRELAISCNRVCVVWEDNDMQETSSNCLFSQLSLEISDLTDGK